MKGSKSPFQAPEPRAGARSHQGGPRGSHTGSLDVRGTWACCGLAAVTHKLFYGGAGGQGLPDCPALLAWSGSEGPSVRARERPACGLSLGTRPALCTSGCPGGETRVCAEHLCAWL